MKSTYVDTRSANVGNIRCLFALVSDSTRLQYYSTKNSLPRHIWIVDPLLYYSNDISVQIWKKVLALFGAILKLN